LDETDDAGRTRDRPTRMPPPSILVIGVLFLVLGGFDLFRGLAPALRPPGAVAADDLWVLAVGVAALVGGAFVIRGGNWARWLLAAWMAFHVALSIRQAGPLAAHVLIFGVITYFLFFRAAAAAHFHGRARSRAGR